MANGGIIGTVNNPTSSTATGVWQQEEQYEAVRDGTWPSRPLFTTKSLRFNRGSSDFLRRTMSTAGTSDKIGTYSGWVKRSTVSLDGMFFEGKDLAANNYTQIYFQATGALTIYGSGGGMDLVTTALFRDPSAWYHVVVAFDTTQGTASNRVKVYVNGVQQTSFSTGTYLAQNATIYFGVNGDQQGIGIREDGALLWNGYMSEIIYVDGQALAPTSFGVANSDGVWTPSIYTGTFGNNGFNLQFENAAALGTDSSPNGNTFTVSNLTSLDQTTDYPKNNFCTINPLTNGTQRNPTLSEGNVFLTNTSGAWMNCMSSFAVSRGKWYFEIKPTLHGTSYCHAGIFPVDDWENEVSGYPNYGGTANSWSYDNAGNIVNNDGNANTSPATYTTNDIIGIAVDLDGNKFYAYKNNALQVSGGSAIGANIEYYFGGMGYNTSIAFNFGNPSYANTSNEADGNGYGSFEYAPPSGYYSLNTANLAEFG